MSLGTVVLNEVVHPIDSLCLQGGGVALTITIHPGPDLGDGSWVVFGSDGVLVLRGRLSDEGMAEVRRAQSIELAHVELTIDLTYAGDKMTDRARAYEERR